MLKTMIKEVAGWIPKKTLLWKQLFVSAKSFLTLPLYKPREDGIQVFFRHNYYVKPDGLIFDGTTLGYYSKIKSIVDIRTLNNKVVIDLGCGQKSLLCWLNEEGISPCKYIGVDFAVEAVNDNIYVANDDINNVDKYLAENGNAIVMCNVLCYINDSAFSSVLCKLNTDDEIIILDPSPNLFWDAHFNGVKPIYRKINEVKNYLVREGFTIFNMVQDYYMKLGNNFIFPFSYCIHAIKRN
jgi:SAM-dependent methyltransferase